MSKSIRISPKHGLNATIPVCFWCGKEKNEIALCGLVKTPEDKDYEMPMKTVMDYSPCDACAEAFAKGVQIIEISRISGDGRPAITECDGQPLYPTGRTLVVTCEAANRIFRKTSFTPGLKVVMDRESFDMLLPDNLTNN